MPPKRRLGRAHITCNKNGIPFDTEKPTITSGIRLGTPAGTTRGFGEAEFRQIGDWIVEVVDGLAANGEDGNAAVEAAVSAKVEALCDRSRSIRGCKRNRPPLHSGAISKAHVGGLRRRTANRLRPAQQPADLPVRP